MFLKIFISYFLLINLITFIVWGIDKWKAIKQKWRISEKTLLIFSLLGGFVGAVIGMEIFRHKTIKSKFLYGFWGIVFIWFIALGTMFYFYLKS